MSAPVYRYKLRAECFVDIARFYLAIVERNQYCWMLCRGVGTPPRIICGDSYGDQEFTFESNATLAQLLEVCAEVPDGHVMAETIAFEAEYTGARTYGVAS